MRTLVISDLHLTHVFDEKKAAFLKKLVSSCDSIILNGDFWDGYRTTFDAFVASGWSKFFPLLKAKETIYLYGNHDKKGFSDDRVSLFSTNQKDVYKLTQGNAHYYIEHGHTLCPTLDEKYSLSRTFLSYINAISQKIEHILTLFKSPHNIVLKQSNRKIKRLQNKKTSHWYICGHTHYPEVDTKHLFANSGFIQYGKASYLIIDSHGPQLHINSYK